MKKNIRKLFILFVMIFSVVTMIGCSKDEPENPGNGGDVNITSTPDPAADTPAPTMTPTPTEEVKPTGSEITDMDNNDSINSGNSKMSQENAITDISDITGTDIQNVTVTPEPVATGDVEPTAEPVITDEPYPVITDYPDYDFMEIKYTDYSGTDERAAKVAEKFVNAYVLGDIEAIKDTLACDDEYREQFEEELAEWQGYSSFFNNYMDLEGYDLSLINLQDFLSMEIIGGKDVDKMDILYSIYPYDTYVDDLSAWDNYQIFSSAFSGMLKDLISDYEEEGLNIIVGEKDGEYKVISVGCYEIENVELDNGEALSLIAEKKIELTGEETADDIINLYIEGYEEFDFFKLFSVTAMDEDAELAVYLDNAYFYPMFEIFKRLKESGQVSITITRSEAVDADSDEITEALDWYDFVKDTSSITDIVKYDLKMTSVDRGEEYLDEFTVLVGKINGVYRVLDDYMFK